MVLVSVYTFTSGPRNTIGISGIMRFVRDEASYHDSPYAKIIEDILNFFAINK